MSEEQIRDLEKIQSSLTEETKKTFKGHSTIYSNPEAAKKLAKQKESISWKRNRSTAMSISKRVHDVVNHECDEEQEV